MGGAVDKLSKGVKMALDDVAEGTKMAFNDTIRPIAQEVNKPFQDMGRAIGDELGAPRNWKDGLKPKAPTPAATTAAAPQEAMPQMDAEAIARARRLAAMKSAGGGRAGTFLGGSGLGNG